MKKNIYLIFLIIISCFLNSCDLYKQVSDISTTEYFVKNKDQEFDSIANTFSFNNFTSSKSNGYCFGIVMTEKCIFENNIDQYHKGYNPANIELIDCHLDSEWFDNENLNFDKIPDNNVGKDILECIDYFQTNQNNLYRERESTPSDIIDKLKENSLVILILRSTNKESHAVLAYGYKINNDKKEVQIYISDPNKRKKSSDELTNYITIKYENYRWIYSYEDASDLNLSMALLNN
jgi:hypothetical protein